jgi:hypothetical protein
VIPRHRNGDVSAVRAALRYFSNLGTVTDTSRTESYDYIVEINGEPWHVEVKGTTGDPHEVLLTPREVEHANEYPFVALFVLSNINITNHEHGGITACGGKASVFQPWSLDRARLSAIGYRYLLPEEPASSPSVTEWLSD